MCSLLANRSKLWVFCLGLFVLLALPSDGLTKDKTVYNLEQLIKLALERSPELKEAQQDIVIAESYLAQAKAAQWPQLEVIGIGGMANDAEPPIVKVNPRPGRGDRLLEGVVEKNPEDQGRIVPFGRLEIAIVQPIYTFGKISYRKKAAYNGIEVQRAAMEKRRGEVIRKVKELYFALILARQGKEAASEADSFIDDARQRIKRLLKLGSTTVDESDLYRLEAYAAETKRFKAKAESGSKLAYMALKQTIGLGPDEDFELDIKELPKDARALGLQDDCIQKALQQRPELEQIEKGLEARRHLVEAAKADLYPTIFAALIGSFAGAPGRAHFDEPYIGDKYNHAGMGPVIGAKWHFDLGIGKAKVQKARAEYFKLLHTKEFAQLNIPLEVAKYYQDALEYQSSYQAYEKAAKAARKWIVVAFANFDMGVGTAKDIFDAIERYGKNQGEFLYSLFKYHVALANLSYAIGEYRSGS